MSTQRTIEVLPLPDKWPDDLAKYVCDVLDQNDLLETKLAKVEQENARLKGKLARYENPNTPPSQRPKPVKPSNPEGKRGAPVGHRGATRPTPEPDQEIKVEAPQCPGCDQDPGPAISQEVRTVTDTPAPQKPVTTRFVLDKHECVSCGHSFTARHKDCPREGQWGIHVYLTMLALRYNARAPLRRVTEILASHFNITMTPKAVMDGLRRIGKACEKRHDALLVKVRQAAWLHVDETSFRVDGKNWWLWMFRTPTNDVFVVIRPSRGKNVVQDVLGPDWDKPLVVDGWKAYDGNEQQRCWAHLLRYVDDKREKCYESEALAVSVHEMYKRLAAVLDEDPPPDQRSRLRRDFEREMAGVLAEYEQCEAVHRAWTYMHNGVGSWFTCLAYPGMQATNNDAERAIRESVIFRKIIGGFRSDSGPKEYEAVASVLAGYRLQGMDPFVAMDTLLREQMCLN